MRPNQYLSEWLENNSNSKHYIFSLQDLRSLFPNLKQSAFKTLISRSVKLNILTRVCRGIYIYNKQYKPDGLLLYHVVAILRANDFNYISLETVLSDKGIISQMPINYISIMSSGRSNIIDCGVFGRIEFIHTDKKPAILVDHIYYDKQCKLWRANVSLALKDMKDTNRNSDLIDWELANELIR